MRGQNNESGILVCCKWFDLLSRLLPEKTSLTVFENPDYTRAVFE